MAFGRTPEQKAADEQRKALERAEVDARNAAEMARRAEHTAKFHEQEDRRHFLASPVGQATTAKEEGHGFFEIQLEVGSSQRDSTIFGGNNTSYGTRKSKSHAGTLASIESVGWKLEHVGHVFVVTNESSRDKFLATGQQVAVSGNIIGIYLFRNLDNG